jgi:hypothetical protein
MTICNFNPHFCIAVDIRIDQAKKSGLKTVCDYAVADLPNWTSTLLQLSTNPDSDPFRSEFIYSTKLACREAVILPLILDQEPNQD